MVPPLDECRFCVREFWQPWLQQLLDIEDEARVEERKATFGARDALSKSERDLALSLRLVAAEAILAVRAAKKDVIRAINTIEAEKAKRKSIDKEKYGIDIPRNNTYTCYKEAMAKAFKSKQMQEHRFEIMKLWSKKWEIRQKKRQEVEEERPTPKPKPLTVDDTQWQGLNELKSDEDYDDDDERPHSKNYFKSALKKIDKKEPQKKKETPTSEGTESPKKKEQQLSEGLEAPDKKDSPSLSGSTKSPDKKISPNTDVRTHSPDRTTIPNRGTQSPDKITSPNKGTQSPDKITSPNKGTQSPDKITSPNKGTQSPDKITSPNKNTSTNPSATGNDSPGASSTASPEKKTPPPQDPDKS
ncbi:hypothetical protein O0L34_g5573 [Tuta absoluta]|nr:hypothetical protein O0L34_g5573 [Tuta absoluta]